MEFGVVFLVFFVVFYGILTYGLIFAAQQSVNLAAQDGARMMLRWSRSGVTAAAALAKQRAGEHLAWIASMSATTPVVSVCAGPRSSSAVSASNPCSGPALTANQAAVVVTYSYGASPLVPNALLLGSLLVPSDLTLQSQVTVNYGYSLDATTVSASAGG